MEKRSSEVQQILLMTATFLLLSLSSLHAAYNGECWVVSNGDTIYKLNSDGLADPTIIPGLTQAQAAVVNPKDGTVWIAVSAANAVFRFDPETVDFKQIPNINQPHSVAINPNDNSVWIGGLDVVQKVSADGTQILATISGVYEPEVAVNVADGSCWVTDSRGKIARYGHDGTAIAVSSVQLKEPKYVTVNSKTGNAWVADPQASILVKLSASGQEMLRITDIKQPTSPRVNEQDGSLWIVSESSSLIKLSASGQKIIENPEAGIAILSISVNSQDGSVWVADQFGETFQSGGEVSKYTATGQKLFGNHIPMPSYVSVGHWPGQ